MDYEFSPNAITTEVAFLDPLKVPMCGPNYLRSWRRVIKMTCRALVVDDWSYLESALKPLYEFENFSNFEKIEKTLDSIRFLRRIYAFGGQEPLGIRYESCREASPFGFFGGASLLLEVVYNSPAFRRGSSAPLTDKLFGIRMTLPARWDYSMCLAERALAYVYAYASALTYRLLAEEDPGGWVEIPNDYLLDEGTQHKLISIMECFTGFHPFIGHFIDEVRNTQVDSVYIRSFLKHLAGGGGAYNE